MVHSQHFSPPQLLEAGQRAEKEGRFDIAAQFYRHLVDRYDLTPEAAEGRRGLGRVAVSEPQLIQPQIWRANGTAAANEAARPQRRRPVAPRDHYRVGRALARLISGAGWLCLAGGLVVPAAYWALEHAGLGALLPRPGPAIVGAAAIGMAITGMLIVFAGHLARALFDQTNAMRDLVALERARIGSD